MRYALKAPWRNGTTQVEFEPVEFIGKLAALVPLPPAYLTLIRAIFAQSAHLRVQLTPAHFGKGSKLASAYKPCSDKLSPS